ncbi:MAG TPA: radical SAM family heme chaperone HemW [Streptosporangiaceae bacterium]|nr:radical SAM family heme chaperone HemW [Streptosporangiaceae bacterium]
MAGVPPDGEAVPADGQLPPAALDQLGANSLGIYVHIPFCTSRCGYCDFNTYTAAELGGGASRESYASLAVSEVRFARAVLGPAAPPVRTVFFGGGTPTLLPPANLARILAVIDAEFGLETGAEVTTEANPESVDQRVLEQLRAAGFTRVSLGMQSAASHVLSVLDRSHSPGRAEQCVAWARSAGFAHVSLDLIYGSPGESAADWEHSVRSAIAAGPDHISAYALIVEDGTRLAARIRRGELAQPDDDEMADRYLAADELFGGAGLHWYEISNWAAAWDAACQHNLSYWTGGNWWGIGPGAHSHVGGTRWWNVRHPAAYAQRVSVGVSPGQAREVLTGAERRTEQIMLATRLATGCDISLLSAAGRRAAQADVADGLTDRDAFGAGRVVLTRRGRLLADAVIRGLTD